MRRTQIRVKDETYQLLQRRAHDTGKSVSAVVREILEARLGEQPTLIRATKRAFRLKDLKFIGMGRSEPSRWDPVSENHDDALAEDLYNEIVEKRDKPHHER